MPGRFFLDSNIVIYAFGDDMGKKSIAKSLLRLYPMISTQVINEVVNVCFRKFGLPVMIYILCWNCSNQNAK